MRRSSFLVLITSALVGVVLAPATASAEPGGPSRPVRGCAELVGDYAIPGAATHVTGAVEARPEGQPAYCEATGFVEPAVRFRLRLPLDNFRGRYLQYGCGGFCGLIFDTPFPDCGPEAGDFAVAATDDGHVGAGEGFEAVTDASWAADNRAARDDFAFRAPHVVSLAAKRVIARFYGTPPVHSYFSGCSTGGREALLLAQRYPTDFDGIIAAAPANVWSPLGAYQAWMARSNTGPDGMPIITAAKLPALHSAMIAECDGLDGLVDGQLEDPRACHFDPATLKCAGADAPTCLTPAQVDAARKLYDGPTDAQGRRLYPGGEAYGSEPAWDGWIIPNPAFGSASAAFAIGDNFLRYAAYPIGTPHSSVDDFRFTAGQIHRLTVEGFKANALNPDLSAFRRAGGKLILWHGWSDQAIPATGTLDYWARVVERNGGQRSTQQFARLFMVPSMFHCAGGVTLTTFDPIQELVVWVEHGVAPQQIVATGQNARGAPRSRPVFPYPLQARYDGTGSVDEAGNFVPARVATPAPDKIRWVGEYLYRLPGPVAR